MVDAVLQHAHTRAMRVDSIHKSLLNAKEAGNEIDYKKLELYVCEEYSCSLRTAKEYIKIAKARLK